MNLFSLADTAVDRYCALNPNLATERGVAGFDHLWTDFSPDGNDAQLAFWKDLRQQIDSVELDGRRDELAYAVLEDHCDRKISVTASQPNLDYINNLGSPHQTLRMAYGSMASNTADDWDAIISRLQRTPEALKSYQESLELGRAMNRTAARRQVETVIEQGKSAIGPSSSYEFLRDRLTAADTNFGHEGSLVAQFSDALDAGIDCAKRAFSEFNDYLRSSYLPDARERDGVGRDRYSFEAESFLGSQLDPDAAYRFGWDEVERLWGELNAACQLVDDTKTSSEVITMLTTDPAYLAPSHEAFVEEMTSLQYQALGELDGSHFEISDQIKVISVNVAPPGGASAAHYIAPSEDFSRPGAVWYPIAERDALPLFSEVTTAYHEGFPGHHLQIGTQMSMGDELCRFHQRMIWYSGSGEGWALYAERLMGELGFLERPEYVVGLLSAQLMRSCRVAIDIGFHLGLPIPDDVSFHPGEQWTVELGEELLIERALVTPYEARSEMIRYLGWPGQAITYKLGEQAILDMLDAYRTKPGFTRKEFHRRVLSLGSIGLDLTRSLIDASYAADR